MELIKKKNSLLRGNVPGLIYGRQQVPARGGCADKKGWKMILHSPPNNSKFDYNSVYKIIRTHGAVERNTEIKVQFLRNHGVPTSVRTACSYYLSHRTQVRSTPHEHGKMVPAEKRFDPRIASTTKYVDTNPSTDDLQKAERALHLSLFHFNELFYKSSALFSQALKHSIEKLKTNTLNVELKGTTHKLLPTYMCSKSLHNSLHVDPNDSTTSFAIFYQDQHKIGLSYLVFPEIGLAIELKSPVLICWEEKTRNHCSVAVKDGINRMFGCSKTAVDVLVKAKESFCQHRKKSKLSQLCVGDLVYVQQKFSDQYETDAYLKNFKKHKYSTKKANVLSINGKRVFIRYKSKGTEAVVDIGNVRKVSEI